jgi:ATP-binding cassette, subfamily B, bacterial
VNHGPTRIWELCAALLPYAKKRWPGLLSTLLTTGVAVLKPWPMKVIVDYVLLAQPVPARLAEAVPGGGAPVNLLWWGVAATVLIFLIGWMLQMAGALVHVTFGQRMVYDLASDLFAHLQRLSLQFHARKAVGDSIRRVTSDCGCVSSIIRDAMLPVVSSVVTLLIMVFVMWQLDPLLTLLAVAVMPALILSLWLYARPMMQRSYRQQEIEGRVYSDIEQTFSAIPLVQAFAREDLHDRQFRAHTGNAIAAAMDTTGLQLQFKLLIGTSTALGTAAIIWVGARHTLDGTLTAGTILVFLAYLASLYRPIESIVYSAFAVQGAAGSAKRVMELLNTPREVDDRLDAVSLPPARGHLCLENVTFGYEPGRPVLRDVSLEVQPGETVAIVGATGVGKTTLLSLVPRFVDPWQGRVLLDGHDLRNVKLQSLRRQVSLVLQDSFLFPATIAENIAYGRPEATREQVVAAARSANAHEFIQSLPQDYDTPVGERGATLSGGERQRIAIARALLLDAPVLILDEPTSHLDAATERSVLQALRRLIRNRTTLVIAHRLSTVQSADRIIVLEQGRIIESGSSAELLAQEGAYARLYRAQNTFTNEGQPL